MKFNWKNAGIGFLGGVVVGFLLNFLIVPLFISFMFWDFSEFLFSIPNIMMAIRFSIFIGLIGGIMGGLYDK